jgi:co-chaperonin GroES (HSP10)
MAIKPLADRVVVRRVPEERRKSLIEIPDSAREKPQEGIVVALGNVPPCPKATAYCLANTVDTTSRLMMRN